MDQTSVLFAGINVPKRSYVTTYLAVAAKIRASMAGSWENLVSGVATLWRFAAGPYKLALTLSHGGAGLRDDRPGWSYKIRPRESGDD